MRQGYQLRAGAAARLSASSTVVVDVAELESVDDGTAVADTAENDQADQGNSADTWRTGRIRTVKQLNNKEKARGDATWPKGMGRKTYQGAGRLL